MVEAPTSDKRQLQHRRQRAAKEEEKAEFGKDVSQQCQGGVAGGLPFRGMSCIFYRAGLQNWVS